MVMWVLMVMTGDDVELVLMSGYIFTVCTYCSLSLAIILRMLPWKVHWQCETTIEAKH